MSHPYDNYALTFFAADFPVDFGNRLPGCAAALHAAAKPDDVLFRNGSAYTFQWWKQKRIAILQNIPSTRIAFQTLGLDVWRNGLKDFKGQSQLAASEFGATVIKRIGFKVVVFFPQSMTHDEMSDLFFGTFLSQVEEWQQVCDSPTDPMIQMHGNVDGMKLQLFITSMNTEQAMSTLTQSASLDRYVKNHVDDPTAIDFTRKLLVSPSFMVDLDLSKEAAAVSELTEFFDRSLQAADKVIAACKNIFLSKKSS
jgi:hypothetical protein